MFPFLPLPHELLRTGFQFSLLMAETQAVMAYRIMGMAGMWPVTSGENRRMIQEKGPAFAEAMAASAMAAAKGQRPDQVVAAAIRPLRRKTRSNSRRLSRRGRR